MTKEKFLKNKKFFIIGGIILLAIILIVVMVLVLNSSKTLKLSKFEEIAVYGYLQDYLTPEQLYYISGESDLDELQYLQLQVKKAIDSYVDENQTDTVPTSAIQGALAENKLIKDANVDFHGIVVSDYEYSPEEDAYIRKEGANRGVSFIESDIVNNSSSNVTTKVKEIKELEKNKFTVYFDLVDDLSDYVSDSGEVVLSINEEDSSLNIDSCKIYE